MATKIDMGGMNGDGRDAGTRSSGAIRGSYYALGLLAAANFMNYLDRSIFSILAEAINIDLKLNDAPMSCRPGVSRPDERSVIP